MLDYEGTITAPEDSYSRKLENLEAHALPHLAAMLADMDECVIVAIGSRDNTVKIVQIDADHGITAPPPDVPSRVREINIALKHKSDSEDFMYDIRQHLCVDAVEGALTLGNPETAATNVIKFIGG